MFSKSLETLLNVLFPPQCVGCGQEGRYICGRCALMLSEAAFVCPTCQTPSFTGERHRACKRRLGLDGLLNAWEYDGVIKRAIHCVKYKEITHIVGELVERSLLMCAAMPERSGVFLSHVREKDTLVTFSPMWRRKERTRGFNQAELLAKEVARILGKQTVPLLLKTRDTKAQVDLEQKARFANVRESIVSNGAWNMEGRSIVVVDDVWTTGATMQECSRALKKAGARDVWGFTIARTP